MHGTHVTVVCDTHTADTKYVWKSYVCDKTYNDKSKVL